MESETLKFWKDKVNKEYIEGLRKKIKELEAEVNHLRFLLNTNKDFNNQKEVKQR